MTTFGHWIALALAGGLGTVARAGVTTVATKIVRSIAPAACAIARSIEAVSDSAR